MTWSDFYLVCFLVGAMLSLASFLLGHLNLHLPGLGDGGHDLSQVGHVDAGHADLGGLNGEHSGAHVVGAHGGAHMVGAHFSLFNFGSIAAFLCWFGGAGYLLTRFSGFWFGAIVLLAVGTGLIGALLVFWFVAKVLMRNEKDLDPADYDMVGVLGRVSSSIRAGGTGEIIYSQEGTRHTAGARSEDGRAIERGEEVVVTRYERGIAYVRRWEELADGTAAGEDSEGK